MNPKPRRRYTAEFKAQAVELLETGRPVAELAEELRHQHQPPLLLEAGLAARAVARLRIDNDILKKAAIILGSKTQPNSEP